jgi:hypothetical protein
MHSATLAYVPNPVKWRIRVVLSRIWIRTLFLKIPIQDPNKLFNSILNEREVSKLNLSDIFRLENLSIWQIPVFRYDLLRRNLGYIEFEMLEKQCWSYLRNIERAINYFFYKRFAHNLSIFSLEKFDKHWDFQF